MNCVIDRKSGRPCLCVNGEWLPPLAYVTYRPDAAQYAAFRRAGCRLFGCGFYAGDQGINSFSGIRPFSSGFWLGPDTYDFTPVDKVLETILPPGEAVYALPRVYLDVPRWWEQQCPDELCRDVRGEPLRQSFSSARWRQDAAAVLQALIAHIEQSPFAERVIGYQVAAGGTEEWAYHRRFPEQMGDYSTVAREAFADFLAQKYGSEEALSRAWGRPVTWRTASVPRPSARRYAINGVLRDPTREQAVIDYYTFHNVAVADSIAYLCRAVKEQKPDCLAGAFYGYTAEIPNEDVGHHALHRLLTVPEIDFFASPHSYLDCRSPGIDWPFMAPVDSALLHGKLWFIENDVRTHQTTLLREQMPNSAPDNAMYDSGVWRGPQTPEMGLSLMQKAAARLLTYPVGAWWFDMWGGWFDDPVYMGLFTQLQQWMAETPPAAGFAPEVAVVIDEAGFRQMGLDVPVVYRWLYHQRRELGFMGAPYRLFLAQDLADPQFCPEAYKLVLLIGLVRPEETVRRGVRRLMGGGRTLVFVSFTDTDKKDGGLSDIRCRYDPAQPPCQGRFEGTLFPGAPTEAPRFAAPVHGRVLTVLADTGEPCVAEEEHDTWTEIVSLLPELPGGLLRRIATDSGVHLYTRSGDIAYAGGEFLGIHAVSAGEKRLYFPKVPMRVTDLLTGTPMRVNGYFMDFSMEKHQTRLFRVVYEDEAECDRRR